ncbi:MAG: helix-turn-helix transcriptional regulator [Bacteroidia bacterium]|nr:helix-turn-helix transcriptional regulator [Bacteroidia bacterium]
MKTSVNQRIKEFRSEISLNQTQFAVKAGLSLPTISGIESNNNTIVSERTIMAICKTFNGNPEWFKLGKGDKFLEGGLLEQKLDAIGNPWKDEAYETVKRENDFLKKQTEWLQGLINNLTQKTGNPNFLKASDVAEIPYYFLSGVYSGANAQC